MIRTLLARLDEWIWPHAKETDATFDDTIRELQAYKAPATIEALRQRHTRELDETLREIGESRRNSHRSG